MRRLSAALTATLLGGVLCTACSGTDVGPGDPAEKLAVRLADALQADAVLEEGEQSALAGLPFADDAQAAADAYAAVLERMDGLEPTVKLDEIVRDGEQRTVRLDWSWPVAEGESWDYASETVLEQSSGDWVIDWSRALVEPSLGEDAILDRSTVPSTRGDITGAGGQVLVTDRPVLRYGIDKSAVKVAVALESARRLAQVVGIDAAAYVKTVKASGESAFVEAITYRKGEVPPAASALVGKVDGLLVVSGHLALAPTKEFAAPILGRVGPVTAEMAEEDPETYTAGDIAGVSGLQSRYDDQLRGEPGVVVDRIDAKLNRHELFEVKATGGDPLALTLDAALQQTAERLLADVGPASALVAIRPSDGAILAAANGPGTNGQNYATYGQAAPGSTFKMVSALALLRAGLTPESNVSCPTSVSVDGKRFENYDDYPASSLGEIPLRTAVAQSCNTAFIGQRAKVGKGDLADAAGSLGLGIDHDLGFPAYFGQVPDPASETEAAADLIGQGKILASPMVMASVIASIQAGETVIPHLIDDPDVGDSKATGTKLTTAEAKQLRTMLRQTVTSGSGIGLADLPGPPAIAKTGTAQFDDGGKNALHAWMVAAHGDLAVAVYVDRGESGSRTAGPILEAFLRAAG